MSLSQNARFTFMTWNIYFGASLIPLFTATPAQIPQRVTEVYRQFLATNFPERAKAIALQIASKKPDIIGLQEAEIWELIPPNANPVVYDFVGILLNELKRMGVQYEVAALNRNTDVVLPSSTGNLVRRIDRDAILVRKTEEIKVINKMEANFNVNLQVQVAGQSFTLLRGWSAIDVSVRGCTFRTVNTHLEPLSPAVQVAQANELLGGPAQTKLPLVFLGDFNSNADGSGTPTYMNLINAGFEDAWVAAGNSSGLTCCQDPDLLNAESQLQVRIDLILFREKNDWNAVNADVVGEDQKSRTPSRLWPSDHAGVFAKLELEGCRQKINVLKSCKAVHCKTTCRPR